MCQLLGVSRNGFYRYQNNNPDNQNDPEHQKILRLIKEIAAASDYSYGTRRIKKAMSERGYQFGRYKARKLMKEAGIQVRHRKKYKITTNSNHKQPVFENVLNRQFSVNQPNQAYASDITYVWTQEGWLYLAVVIDLFSRRIVGWSMSSRMKTKLVCDALNMAIWQRQPAPGLIVHSDRFSIC
jgi:putative transposase